MVSPLNTDDAERLIDRTIRAQLTASDPNVSAWVSANAGAGKTHVLKTRVLRLLLSGTKPDRILCLTFTKSAAAEMAARVFSDLSAWATCPPEALSGQLQRTLGRPPDDVELEGARKLFARAIETPGGLKVQTIHAFCERLLQRFPLEAGVPPGFAILDDETAGELKREAIDMVLGEAVRDRSTPLGRALGTMIAYAAEDGFDDVLSRAISQREWIDTLMRVELHDADHFRAIEARYRSSFKVRADVSSTGIQSEIAELLSDAQLEQAVVVLQEGSKRDQERAGQFRAVRRAQSIDERVAMLEKAVLTSDKKPRADSQLVTKGIRDAYADLVGRLSEARDRCAELVAERQGLIATEATMALLMFADRVHQAYSEAKARRASLDFEDLILHASWLLRGANAAEWVLYKLDGGLDHILVDEAQDTSPAQWDIVDHLAREFFSGSSRYEQVRTLFAVGDEKQSIYSFQGAAPKMFADAGRQFQVRCEQAGCRWEKVPLSLSFRTVSPILDAVDRVFRDVKRTPGINTGEVAIRHEALRIGQAGLLEIWPSIAHEDADEGEIWSPSDDGGTVSPVSRVAAQIAGTIAGWLADGELLVSEGRPLCAGDILILVNRREPFAAPMVAALKARGIPVAGADRMKLAEQVIVEDLLALADFLTMPEDDLALATVLKSPMFGLDDDDLLQLAPDRKGMLWVTLLGASQRSEKYLGVVQMLKRWRAQSDIKPPFEFFSAILDRDGMRARFLRRLGAEAIDPLDEFLSLSISFDDKATPSLTGFVDFVRKARRELKRDMEHGRNEVRVMTVHGAKGLEAPIVFLPDTCSAPAQARNRELVKVSEPDPRSGDVALLAWPVKGTSRLEAIAGARARAAAEQIEERNRLLYVAMTRARDRLYIAGFEGKLGRAGGCWYDTVLAGLEGCLVEVALPDGTTVLRTSADQCVPAVGQRDVGGGVVVPVDLPEWAGRSAPAEQQITIPLVPSRLAPLEVDEAGDPVDPVPLGRDVPTERGVRSPLFVSREQALLRGTLTHALLEHLPSIAPGDRRRVADAFVAVRGDTLSDSIRRMIVEQTLRVLDDDQFADVFGPFARAEVGIAAEVPREGKPGERVLPPLRITGQIDRLLVTDDEVLIVDYKTNRLAPETPGNIDPAYLFQLAAYRLAVRRIYPDRDVRAAILWTDGPRLMAVPESLLNNFEQRLRELDRTRLDALIAGT